MEPSNLADGFLEESAFSKIGKVVEVNGKSVLVQVDKEKNLSNLFYKGIIYRNVGIGSYLKIRKDYIYIIGKINKEFIKEKPRLNIESFRPKNSTLYDRYVEINIIGYMTKNEFKRGVRELPFLFNDAFLMSEEEVKKIYEFKSKKVIEIGQALFEDVTVEAGITRLFASHIGVFGNTGSGKSNTLTRLYNNLFNSSYINVQGKSKFLLFDFNGEYAHENTMTTQKKIIKLSTQSSHGDKLIIKKDCLDDDFWSIILEATEKTQKPFIKRTLKFCDYLLKDDENETLDHIINLLSSNLRKILEGNSVSNKELDAHSILKQCIINFFNVENEENYREIFRSYHLHGSNLCRQIENEEERNMYNNINNSKIYFGAHQRDNVNLEVSLFKAKLESLKENVDLSYINFFEMVLGLKLVDDTIRNMAQFEHISPIFNRFQKRKTELNKLLEFSDEDFLTCEPYLICISLKDVNIDMRKIIPLLITKISYEEHKKGYAISNKNTLHFIIDEAHNILSEQSFRESESWKDYRLEVFEEIIKEGRKFGVFVTISSQRPSDISNTIISQLHNVFIHRLINNNDLKTMSQTISFLDKVSFDSIPVLPAGACIFTGIATETPIAVQIPILEKESQPKSDTVDLEELWTS
ncbi:ATP-binding protein [Mesobacillus maritimus]|uniref:ATP-binding protein n=1 Tax=Mesobacillus maritimus TaxID=1643336 RepID=UPI00203CD04F|nr:ATP-binding protein [Mesobacillus maritimus]MCM3671082.1 ATP-binding protein [Mesobacillus maritimus]